MHFLSSCPAFPRWMWQRCRCRLLPTPDSGPAAPPQRPATLLGSAVGVPSRGRWWRCSPGWSRACWQGARGNCGRGCVWWCERRGSPRKTWWRDSFGCLQWSYKENTAEDRFRDFHWLDMNGLTHSLCLHSQILAFPSGWGGSFPVPSEWGKRFPLHLLQTVVGFTQQLTPRCVASGLHCSAARPPHSCEGCDREERPTGVLWLDFFAGHSSSIMNTMFERTPSVKPADRVCCPGPRVEGGSELGPQ